MGQNSTIVANADNTPVYVKVDAGDHDGIEFVKLYVNNEFVRQENNDPYEWGKPHVDHDYPLNNMKTGTYKIVAVAVDHHGNQPVKHINISVGEGFCNCPNNYDPVIGCDGKEYSNACVAECNGQYCPDSGENNIQIEFITPIEPEHNFRYKAGIDLFVKVDAKDNEVGIEKVELYVNGEYLRSEYHAPYEWGKPHVNDDHPLNNLSAGGYEITAVAINKDGVQRSETVRIRVR